MRRSPSALRGLASLLVVMGGATSALAQPASPLEQAKTQFNLGAQAYTAGRYELAVTAFDEAYKLLPRSEILFSLAQAEKKQCVIMKDGALLRKALTHYRQYYAAADASRKTDAAEAIGYLEQLATQAEFGGAPAAAAAQKAATKLSVYASVDGAHVYVDGRSQGDVPFVGPVAPGKHRVLVRLDGYEPAERDVFVAEGTTQTLPMTLAERPVGVAFDTTSGAEVHVDGAFLGRTPLPVAGVALAPGVHTAVLVKNGRRLATKDFTVERGKPMVVRMPLEVSNQRVAAFAVGGVGVASLVASGVFYGIALAEESRALNRETQRNGGNLQPVGLEQYNNALGNRDTYRAAGTVAALGGAAALSAGVLLYAFDKPDPNSVPLRAPEGPKTKPKSDFEVAVAPLLAPGTAGVGALGRF